MVDQGGHYGGSGEPTNTRQKSGEVFDIKLKLNSYSILVNMRQLEI